MGSTDRRQNAIRKAEEAGEVRSGIMYEGQGLSYYDTKQCRRCRGSGLRGSSSVCSKCHGSGRIRRA